MPHVEYKGSDGNIWPSATQLTSLLPQPWLLSWYKSSVYKWGKRGWQRNLALSARGQRVGTEVHSLIEWFILQSPELIAPVLSGKYESQQIADALFDKVNPLVEEYIAIEPHLISKELKIHGTADMIYRQLYQPGLRIGDWKTSASKSDTHAIQLAIYALCWNEEHPDQLIDSGDIFRVDKKSKRLTVHIDEYNNLKQYYPVVKALREIYSYSNKLGAYANVNDIGVGPKIHKPKLEHNSNLPSNKSNNV